MDPCDVGWVGWVKAGVLRPHDFIDLQHHIQLVYVLGQPVARTTRTHRASLSRGGVGVMRFDLLILHIRFDGTEEWQSDDFALITVLPCWSLDVV